MKSLVLILCFALSFSCMAKNQNTLVLPSLFSQHMVLQQKEEVVFWGKSNSEAEITIRGSWGETAKSKAAKDGKWTSKLRTPGAGGPYKIEISNADTTILIDDVLIGEVWLASGQSNMEMRLKGWPPADTVQNSKNEIASASYQGIRMFTVAQELSDTPLSDVKAVWNVCNPQNAPDLSATAYFFAREVHKKLGVPVGVINSSWGGTPAESWVSNAGLSGMDDFKELLKKISVSSLERKKINEWMKQLPAIDLSLTANSSGVNWSHLDLKDAEAATENFNDRSWKTMQLPSALERGGIGEFDGVVWFRKEFEITDEKPSSYKLSLGPIDDMDMTYVNGKLVGTTVKDGLWQSGRVYEIPEGLLKKGKNVISVKVMDTGGGGGIWGKKEQLFLQNSEGGRIELAGEWKYLPSAEYRNGKLYLFGIDQFKFQEKPFCSMDLTPGTPTALFNAMIAPLTSYKIKGVIWYQGEANVGNAKQYERLFPALITDWRKQWNSDVPFYFVQIAPWAYQNDYQKGKSQELRDAQRKALSLPGTGMVVSMDIGNNANIHPANKQDVGKRLALWAFAKTYGQKNTCSGPLYEKHRVEGQKIIISFSNTGSGLKQNGKMLDGFEIAGADKVFYPAKALIKDKNVMAWSDKVKAPVAVRYAWSDTASATLFNKEGLPASSFQSDY
ncbi:sialate O-acetylesterase [Parabacteroides sp. FAFU027]|uniref:sialate O-acetylesterase n=1 Tax=Parabacteroides sp. FAFU027 TaxID=2922715 RepID=UPI001FAF5BFA|nr:sialate O-acetylesterase [Parabacteroides sp. FAFU027]